MPVDEKHPDLTPERTAEWQLCCASMDGESEIKRLGTTYLPKPSGFTGLANLGSAMYDAYKYRAQFPEIMAPSVAAMIGIVHGKPIKIEIPRALEYLLEDADGNGLTLDAFHRRITRALLVTGRYCVLADAPIDGGYPVLHGYAGEALTNWDRDWYILDECHSMRVGFTWKPIEQYREIYLDGGRYRQNVWTRATPTSPWVMEAVEPVGHGNTAMDFVPFTVANARDISTSVETPPLIGVARAALAIYQLSADYRHQLYMSGQETLVAINGPAPSAVGAGVVHEMIGAERITPDLKYVSPSCSGIDAHLRAMEDDRTAAVQAGARLLEQSDQVQESGSARKLRFASETATLTSVAHVSCALLERALRNIARILNIPEDGVIVSPPKDLLDNTMTPADAQSLVAVWQAGGISYQTLYENLQRGGIASEERDFNAESTLLDGEQFAPQDVTTAAPMA